MFNIDVNLLTITGLLVTTSDTRLVTQKICIKIVQGNFSLVHSQPRSQFYTPTVLIIARIRQFWANF